MDDLISRLSDLRSQYNLFDENEQGAYHTLTEAIAVLNEVNEFAQPEERTKKHTETHACDLISRQKAIDLIEDIETKRLKGEIGLMYAPAINGLKALPSAQPETHEERTETHACDCISRKASIDADGLDEEIRCEMCENPMHTDRGCDGNCKYDEKLYEKIMQILDERIKPLPSAQPTQLNTPNTLKALDCISRQDAVDIINGYAEQFNGYIGTPNDSEVYAYARGLLLNIERNISALPSAQPEIIKCRDCKHRGEKPIADGRYWCEIHDTFMYYCSDAERRTDD